MGTPGAIPLTIWAVPRPFGPPFDVIQRNAVWSWKRLGAQVFYVGKEDECAVEAAEMGIPWYPVRVNDHGVPVVSDALAVAAQHAEYPVRVYSNSDTLFLDDLSPALEAVAARFERFVGVGFRRDVKPVGLLETPAQLGEWLETAILREHSGVDYFAYQGEGLWAGIPDFAVGRAAYDNWMAKWPLAHDVPLVDLTEAVHMMHQWHDERPGRTWDEIEVNRSMAGNELASVFSCNWKLTANGAGWEIVSQ